MRKQRNVVTCYVSAPIGTDVKWIREPLIKRGVQLAIPDPTTGVDLYATVGDIIRRCDLVIGVLTGVSESNSVAFELGMAAAMKRRIVVFAESPHDMHLAHLTHYLVLRIDSENHEAVEFVLDNVLTATEPRTTWS